MKTHKEIFVNNIIWWIQDTGRQKKWVAEQIGISNSGLSQWLKRGSFPANSDYLTKLSDLIGVPLFILFIPDGVKNAKEIIKAVKQVVKDFDISF